MCNSEGLPRELWNLNLETASEGKDPKSISALRCTTHGWETHVTTTTTTVSPHFTSVLFLRGTATSFTFSACLGFGEFLSVGADLQI